VPFGPRDERGVSLDAAVLDAGERQSLVAVRSLGRAGVRVGVFDWERSPPAFTSRWSAAIGHVPDCAVDPDGFVDGLLGLLERYSIRVVIPARDGTIEALRARRADFEGRVALALADEEPLGLAMDKGRTLELARTLGIPVPRTVPVADLDQLDDAVREVGLPAVAKPRRSWVHGAATGRRLRSEVVVSLAEARDAFGRAQEAGGSLLLQQLLSGTREAVSLVYADGRVWARFAQIAHRMVPPLGGSSVVRESIPLPTDLAEAAERLIVAAGLEGYSEIEFRRDADGTGKLMEINPRLSASVEIAVRAGVDFPLLLYSWAAGAPLVEIPTYRAGVRMRWLGGDLRWLRMTLGAQGRPEILPAHRALTSFVVDCFRVSAYDYLDLGDIRPALSAATQRLGRGARRWLRPRRRARG
jgi:predicted ATP-grasp superfamily ATP-dependent carboligase